MNINQSQIPFDVPENRDQEKAGKRRMLICITGFAVLGLIVGLIFGYSTGDMNLTKRLYPIINLKADTSKSKRDVAAEYINPKESEFSWDINNLTTLKFGYYDKPDLGTPIEDILDEYGKAIKGSFRGDRIDLEWGELDDYDQDEDSFYYRSIREMELAFKKEGDHYYLQNISYSGDYRKAKAAYMPSDYYDKLKVGDPKTGKGGVSYKEVIGDNAVLYLTMSAGEDIETDEVITKMRIQFNSSGSDEYKLTFIKQADGDFLLAKKGAD